jgi:hypothetical protein
MCVVPSRSRLRVYILPRKAGGPDDGHGPTLRSCSAPFYRGKQVKINCTGSRSKNTASRCSLLYSPRRAPSRPITQEAIDRFSSRRRRRLVATLPFPPPPSPGLADPLPPPRLAPLRGPPRHPVVVAAAAVAAAAVAAGSPRGAFSRASRGATYRASARARARAWELDLLITDRIRAAPTSRRAETASPYPRNLVFVIGAPLLATLIAAAAGEGAGPRVFYSGTRVSCSPRYTPAIRAAPRSGRL